METPEPDASDNLIHGLSTAPETFVEGYRGAMMRAGVLKLNFFANRFNPATELVEKHAAVTLSVPLEDFAEIVRSLGALVHELREKGTLPKEDAT